MGPCCRKVSTCNRRAPCAYRPTAKAIPARVKVGRVDSWHSDPAGRGVPVQGRVPVRISQAARTALNVLLPSDVEYEYVVVVESSLQSGHAEPERETQSW